jgi:hypothetical protein
LTKEIAENGETIKATANYVVPFEGCSRIFSTYYIKKSGFASYERAHNYIFKICEIEKDRFEVTMLAPQIDPVTGVPEVIDRTPKSSNEAAFADLAPQSCFSCSNKGYPRTG